MEHIIHQLTLTMVEKITKKSLSDEIYDIDALASDVEQICKDTARTIIESVVQQMNQTLRDDKAGRKSQGLVLKEKNRERHLYTKLGTLDLKRDYYYSNAEKRYVAVLDHVLGLKAFERVGRTVSAEMVSLAADISYSRSAAIASAGALSRQTVRNHILKWQTPTPEIPAQKRQVRELHVYADEDHVHMQKPNKQKGKKNQIVPLVTVTEGTVPVGLRRNCTQGKTHFVDEEFDTKNLWKRVEGFIDMTYDLETLEYIYLHGDGGRWILNGLDSFAQTEHVMDGYHYAKAQKAFARRFPEKNVSRVLKNALERDDESGAMEYLDGLCSDSSPEEQEVVHDFKRYLAGNWRSIRNLKTLQIAGSCTEAQVSHVLAERFSRDPLGWSKEGLGKLSCIRVYKENGNRIEAKDFDNNVADKTYVEYAEKLIEESIAGTFDWSIFKEKEIYIPNHTSGTQVMLHALGTDYGILKS